MLIPSLALILALATQTDAKQTADPWTLKPALEWKAKAAWDVTAKAQVEAVDHQASFRLEREIETVDGSKVTAGFRWRYLVIDGEEGQDLPKWDALLGARGEILNMAGDTDDTYRRMLAPFVFAYPDKPVSIGDKWTWKTPSPGLLPKMSYTYDVQAIETVDGNRTLKIGGAISEDKIGGLTGEGTWWVSRVGRVIKFTVHVRNWVIPMAGKDPTDAILTGVAN